MSRAGIVGFLALLAIACAPLPAHSEFAAAISPPRFELEVAAGQTQHSVLEIAHVGSTPGQYRVYTADWTMSAGGDLSFAVDLAQDSCRPWVAIEKRTVTIGAASKLRFRFEVSPPADAAPVECRFALMIEGVDEPAGGGAAGFPMSGRIAVIVYARVGDVKPDLHIDEMLTAKVDGRDVPALRVTNVGRATGRFVGFLGARDVTGRYVDLAPDGLPLLPGMTRVVGLLPVAPVDRPDDPPPKLDAWPVAVKGSLEIGGQAGVRIPVEQVFKAP
ncbi:MAG TPA: hypothetical protein VIY30_18685 [Burkholderiaceae bacterium]